MERKYCSEDCLNLTVSKKTSIAEKFGDHPSDQSWALKYFINNIYDNFYELVKTYSGGRIAVLWNVWQYKIYITIPGNSGPFR